MLVQWQVQTRLWQYVSFQNSFNSEFKRNLFWRNSSLAMLVVCYLDRWQVRMRSWQRCSFASLFATRSERASERIVNSTQKAMTPSIGQNKTIFKPKRQLKICINWDFDFRLQVQVSQVYVMPLNTRFSIDPKAILLCAKRVLFVHCVFMINLS